jgi:hypothetical protein
MGEMRGTMTSIMAGTVILAALTAAAAAPGKGKPFRESDNRVLLPNGLTLVLEKSTLTVRRGTRRARIEVPASTDIITDVEARQGPVDGSVIVTITDSCDERHVLNFTVPGLEARLENVAALDLHRQRRWNESAAGFARAVALDPTFDVAATNLASAQVMLGKPDDAMKTIAPLLARAPVATYAKLVSDPELAPLLQQAEVAALRVPVPGTARLKQTSTDVGLERSFALSSRYRVVAAVHRESGWGICTSEAELVLLDLKGVELARMRLYDTSESTTDEEHGCPIAKSARPRVAARVAAAQRLLTDLGFSPAGELGQQSTTDSGLLRRTFPHAKVGLVIGPKGVRALHGDHELGAAPTRGESLDAAAFLDGYDAIAFTWSRSGREGCEGTDPTGVQVLPLKPDHGTPFRP